MKKINKIVIIILLISAIAVFAGCESKKGTTPGTGTDWCKAGSKIISSTPESEGTFLIKGLTTYQGKEVCEAEWSYDGGSMTQFFNEDGSYGVTIIKDKDGNIIQEISANQ